MERPDYPPTRATDSKQSTDSDSIMKNDPNGLQFFYVDNKAKDTVHSAVLALLQTGQLYEERKDKKMDLRWG